MAMMRASVACAVAAAILIQAVPVRAEKAVIPETVRMMEPHLLNIGDYVLTIDIGCEWTPEAKANWQLQVHGAIVQAYQQRLKDYQEQVSARALQVTPADVLKGTNPADLPVEQPMTFDFVVNMKTAQALGITFPNEIMLQVTEVIQ